MKKIIILSMLVITLCFLKVSAFAAEDIHVVIEGQEVNYTVESGSPFIDTNGRIQVPLRRTMENYGAEVGWNKENQSATLSYQDNNLEIPINKNYIINNGNKIENDTEAIVKEERTYLPIRIVVENLGANVKWDQGTSSVVIRKDIENLKKTYWKDRVWAGIPDGVDYEAKQQKIEQLKTEISDLEDKYNKASEESKKYSSGETFYWITGDVVVDNSQYYIISGNAYGFGAGMCEYGMLKVLKPTEGVNLLGMYSGTHVYVEDEFSGGQAIKIYKDEIKSPKASEAESKKNELASKLAKAKKELETVSVRKEWWERPYVEKMDNGKERFYNFAELYTIEIPGMVSVRQNGYNYSIDVESTYINYIGDERFYNDGDIEKYLESNVFDECCGKYEKVEEVIDENNGIVDAYIKHYDERYFSIYIVSDKNLIIDFSVDGSNYKEAYDEVIKTIKTLIIYQACG